MIRVRILRVSPRPWGALGFGIDQSGREIQFRFRAKGEALGLSNRRSASVAQEMRAGGHVVVLKIHEDQVKRVVGQAPAEFLAEIEPDFAMFEFEERLRGRKGDE